MKRYNNCDTINSSMENYREVPMKSGITAYKFISEEEIKKVATLLKNTRPAYEELIIFYEKIFIAQEESKQHLNIDQIRIEHDKLKLKLDNAMPLVSPSEFIIDLNQAEVLLKKICSCAKESAPKLKDAASSIILSIKNSQQTDEKHFNLQKVFKALIQQDQETLDSAANAIGVTREALTFFAFTAIVPAIQKGAAQLADVYLKSENSWMHGYCPVCGSLPQMAFLNQDGEKYLLCSFCLDDWKTSRTGCALCQNRDKDKQHYFYNEEEKEYRVDLCDSCGKYIKLVDTRELARNFYPQLEAISTLHLDMQATEQGYKSGLQTSLS